MGIGNWSNPADAGEVSGLGAPSAPEASRSSMVDPASIPKGRADEPEVKVKEKPPTATTALVNALENEMQRDVSELAQAVAPIKPYKDRLAEAGISLEHARTVLDRVLMHGTHYDEEVRIGPTLRVKFRTRQVHDSMRIFKAIEDQAPRFVETSDDIKVRYMLASSLETYGTRTFIFPVLTKPEDMIALDEAFNERLFFVCGINDFALPILIREFKKFDDKIRLILSEGAVEAF
jgi:hypothetical protein